MHRFFECRGGICSPKVSVRVSDVDPPFLKSFWPEGRRDLFVLILFSIYIGHIGHFYTFSKIIEKIPSEEREKVSYVNFLHRTLIGHIGHFGEKEF